MSLIENLLPDRFKVIEELGRGGTSVVVRAHDGLNNQDVAVKILLKDSEEDRFQREAERLADLSHPNVVTFLEVGRHEGRDFLVMEYVEAGDLSSFVHKLTVVQILRLFIQICDGLAHLHDRGIIHRDLKPANILVDRLGKPKIADLGVARQMERNTRLTQAGTILGTYSFLAPEQILSSTVGPRADLYSLGICLFMALTGRKPFEAENEFTMLKAHLEAKPPSVLEFLPEAPQSLDDIVQQLLAKEEENRPRSARAVADLLQAIIEDLQKQDQQDLQPLWAEKIEALHDDLRSVLLAITFLGEEATFEKVCKASPFSEDKTDRCLEELMNTKLIDSPTEDSFRITFPEETIQTRLTPRLRKLFASRLDMMADSRENSLEASLEKEKEEAKAEGETFPVPTVPSDQVVQPEAVLPENVDVPPQGAEPVVPSQPPLLEAVPLLKPEAFKNRSTKAKLAPKTLVPGDAVIVAPKHEVVAPAKPVKPEPIAGSHKRLTWGLATMLALLLLTLGGYWYWAHSASITITSQPAGAELSFNGVPIGVTPQTVSGLKPGLHAFELTLEKHAETQERLELGFGESKEAHYTLEPIVGKLLLTLAPVDALVTIDQETRGSVNSELMLTAGPHKLKVEKTGFEPYESEIILSEERPLEVSVELKPIVAEVKVTSTPKGAEVSLDGQALGKTPLVVPKVAYGKHDIRLNLQGHRTVTRSIELISAAPQSMDFKLEELPGGLFVDSVPTGAKLKLNGEVKGKTPQTVKGLKAGTYTIVLSKDGYLPVEEKVVITAGVDKKETYYLEAPRAAPVDPPPSTQYVEPSNTYVEPTYSEPAQVEQPYVPPQPQPASEQPWAVEGEQ